MNRQVKFVIIILISGILSTRAQYDFEKAFPNIAFTSPVDLQNAGDGSNRLFVVEQAGKIKVFQNQQNVTSTKIFLDIADQVTSGGETGLLGLAFHPDYKSNGYFYVNYTAPNPLRTIISRFKVSSVNSDSADKSSEYILMSYNQPYSNHNGGCIAFGSDGYLYISSGDGGSGGDPDNNAQNITNPLGKILRIDVDNPQSPLNYGIPAENPFVDSTDTNIRKEIYAWGLRNPWRFSFDPETNLLWCGDVGQGNWEEVDIIKNGKNYGWRCYEGAHDFNTTDCNGVYEMPVWEYSHSLGISITGGFVYRGKNVPELTSKYIYGDYGSRRVWALQYDVINPTTSSQITTAAGSITSFGVDEEQELYLVSFDGNIYKFIPTIASVNENNIISDYKLFQNYPNPFNPSTNISWQSPVSGWQTLIIYDVLGNEIATLVDEERSAGFYSIEFNPDNFDQHLASGIYFYRLVSGSFSQTHKMILLK